MTGEGRAISVVVDASVVVAVLVADEQQEAALAALEVPLGLVPWPRYAPAVAEVVTLSPTGRAARTAATLVAGALLTAGTLWGDDDAFPFGPFRMFSTSSNTTGAISVAAIEARVAGADWQPAPLGPATVGMNRAELEGQLPRIQADPSLLGRLAATYSRLHPDAEPWTGLRLVRRSTVVVDRVPTGEVRETVLAEWTR